MYFTCADGFKHSDVACINEGSHSFTCHPHLCPPMGMNRCFPNNRECPNLGRYSFSIPHGVGALEAELAWVAGCMPFSSP